MIKLIKKDLRLFFSNKQDVVLTFIIPIIFITIFSFVFGSGSNSEGLVHVVAGTSVMMLLFSIAGIGGSFLDEKQEGMLKKLLCSPIPANYILYGKLVCANLISIIQLTVMFIYAWLVLGLNIVPHIPSLLLIILAIAFACSGFGVVIASFAKTRQQVQGLSTIIVLVMSVIGGSMIPLYVMPEIIQKIAVFTVNYWGIQGVYDIFLNSVPLTDITFLSKVMVLIGIGISLNYIALVVYRKNIIKIA